MPEATIEQQEKKYEVTPDIVEAMNTIRRGVDTLLIESELEQKLARAKAEGGQLRCKLGLDPTAPDIHIGHTVVLNKLRQLQDLGHKVIFLIGDFTAAIGDPSGRNVTRPPLSNEQIRVNAETYLAQAGLVLDLEKTEVRYNSEWCNQLGAEGLIKLASRYTLARLLERDDFAKRYAEQAPIAMHELIYPLMQGYDSVALRADLELGGSDQRFNLLVGRELQRQYGQEAQCILTMPLLVGLDGVNKMSKSKKNYIGITDTADEMFGKVMSISDDLMWNWYDLLSLKSNETIAQLKKECSEGRNPRDAKVLLAKEIVAPLPFGLRPRPMPPRMNSTPASAPAPCRATFPSVTVAGARRTTPSASARMLKAAGLVAAHDRRQPQHRPGRRSRSTASSVTDKGLKIARGDVVTVQVGKRRWAKVTVA